MSELKPEDVMKALECCTFNPKCDECPLGGEDCINLDQLALALLREKDAEIERLKNSITFQVVMPDEKMEEIKAECLKRVELDVKESRADAITEFEKELTSELIKGCIYPAFVKGAIERTAKKMKGETDVETDL